MKLTELPHSNLLKNIKRSQVRCFLVNTQKPCPSNPIIHLTSQIVLEKIIVLELWINEAIKTALLWMILFPCILLSTTNDEQHAWVFFPLFIMIYFIMIWTPVYHYCMTVSMPKKNHTSSPIRGHSAVAFLHPLFIEQIETFQWNRKFISKSQLSKLLS